MYTKLLYVFFTPFAYLSMFFRRIKFGKNILFCGMCSFAKANNSEIIIGDRCRFMSIKTGNKLGLNHQCILSATKGAVLIIGSNCRFSGTSIRCFSSISIGNNVRVGANVLIVDGDGHQDDPRAGMNKPIVIEDNVWLGCNVFVKKGVTIGRNSVVGMNSVVTKDIPANCIAIGNPCVVVRKFDEMKINQIEDYFKMR